MRFQCRCQIELQSAEVFTDEGSTSMWLPPMPGKLVLLVTGDLQFLTMQASLQSEVFLQYDSKFSPKKVI